MQSKQAEDTQLTSPPSKKGFCGSLVTMVNVGDYVVASETLSILFQSFQFCSFSSIQDSYNTTTKTITLTQTVEATNPSIGSSSCFDMCRGWIYITCNSSFCPFHATIVWMLVYLGNRATHPVSYCQTHKWFQFNKNDASRTSTTHLGRFLQSAT